MTDPKLGYGDSHTLEFPALPKLDRTKQEAAPCVPPEQFEPHDFTD